MEQYKYLYKNQNSHFLSLRQHNRKLQEESRNKQRKERFQDSRNIQSPSPTPQKREIIVEICPEECKENANNTNQQKDKEVRVAKIICSSSNLVKLTKQEEYLKRFIKWKETKKFEKQQQKQEKEKKIKPFLTAVANSRQATTTTMITSIVPKGHDGEFRPKLQLKMPEVSKKTPTKGRQSIYTVVPTPPRKAQQTDEKFVNKFSSARKALPSNLHTKITHSCKALNKSCKASTENKKDLKSVTETATANKVQTKTAAGITKLALRSQVKKLTTEQNLAKTPGTSKFLTKTSSKENLKPITLKMPPPPPPAKTEAKAKPKSASQGNPNDAAKQNGAPGKIRSIATKRAENMRQAKKSPFKNGGACLAQNLKAKKPSSYSKKLPIISTLKLNGKNFVNQFNSNHEQIEDMIIQTPKDFATLNPFDEFVTSTKLKSSCIALEEAENKRLHNNVSAKRNIMHHEEVKAPSIELEGSEKIVKKYNFLINPENTNNEEDLNLIEGEKTPTKYGPEERPINYLSPFVSVARGKVSLKKETEKRNSMYLQNTAENMELTSENVTKPSDSPKSSQEVRRTLEAVRYFRQQLQSEIDRLHKLCDVWEEYKNENLEKIQNANGEDMINVTIGQTRLLTSKKFMQFKGLIDRCESGATGVGAVAYDGSEDTKPITSTDLEGFWSMLGLQVENLGKRFETLNRWKSNAWVDPDEVKVNIKKNLSKVKKTKIAPAAKAKPSTALQHMLRKMQAEMRKNNNNNNNEVIVLTSSKQSRSDISSNQTARKSIENSSTSRRMSILVKDRKYFSPAATVLSVSSPDPRRLSRRKSSQDSPKILKSIQKFNEALEKLETSLNDRESTLLNSNCLIEGAKGSFNCTQSQYSSPVPLGRKSILKTPGTANSRLRNVIFNEKLRVKKFNFLINEDGGDLINATEAVSNDSIEEDLPKSHEDKLKNEEESPKRTLTLRNRKVHLRPSCEIVIPVKHE